MSIRSGQIIIIPIKIPHQVVNILGCWASIGYNVVILYQNLTVFWIFIWGVQATVIITVKTYGAIGGSVDVKNVVTNERTYLSTVTTHFKPPPVYRLVMGA